MDDLNITMKEYIRLEEEKSQKHGKVFNWETAMHGRIWYDEDIHDLKSIKNEFPAIIFNDSLTSGETLSCEPTPKVSCVGDLYFFKDFEKEFPAIVYNDALTSKSDLSTEPTLCPQHIDEFDSKDERQRVIKEEFEKIMDVKVEDILLTCDTQLEIFNREVSRLSRMDDDLFTYEVEVANIPCNSKRNDDSEDDDDDMGTMDHYTMKALWIYWIRGDDEVELIDDESSDDMNEVAETYLLRTLRDSRHMKITRIIRSKNGTRTYHGSMRSHGLTLEFGPNPHQLNILASLSTIRLGVKNGQHVDYKWYEALEDSELKDEALRNKAIMEGFIKEDDDESRYEQKRRWNTYTNYDDAYEINHEHNKSEELCEVHELPVCNIRRYMMIKYSFNDDEEYVAVKEDEYDDLTVTRKEACRAYQEIFQIMDEGWMVTRAE
ncbi:hypothetical protein Tco_0045121 [Tanacetum coccineum]